MPYSTLVPGTTITAAWANANVRDQVVTPFATAAARTSAITSPVEGMLTYLSDSDTLWHYSGTAWVPANALANPVGVSAAAVSSGTDTTTSDTYANMAGTGALTSVSITKLGTGTRIRVAMSVTFSSSVGGLGGQFGVLVNGVDTDVCKLSNSVPAASTHLPASGWNYISGLAAGTYTVQGRWHRTAATGTLTRDGNDWLAIEAQEVQ
jgi:hypothetical protein